MATYNTDGSFLAVGPGSTTIKAVLEGGLEATATLTVTNLVTALDIEPASNTVSVGGTAAFTVTATLADGSLVDYTREVTWLIDDAGVAAYNSNGSFVALAPGSTTVRAVSAGGLEASAQLNVTAPLPPPGSNVSYIYAVANNGINVFAADLDAGTFARLGALAITGKRGLFLAYDRINQRIWANRSRTEKLSGFDLIPSTGLGNRTSEFAFVAGSEGRRWAIDPNRPIAFASWLVPSPGVGAHAVEGSPPYLSPISGPLDGQVFQVLDMEIVSGEDESTAALLSGGMIRGYAYGDDRQFTELADSPLKPRVFAPRDLVIDPTSACGWAPGMDGVDGFKLGAASITPLPGFPRTDVDARSGAVLSPTKVAFADDRGRIQVFDYDANSCALTESGSPVDTGLETVRDIVTGPGGLLFVLGSVPGGVPDVDPDRVQAFRLNGSGELEALGPALDAGVFATDLLALRFL